MTFEQTLIISIVTAVTTGILSIFGVILTLRQNNKQIQLQIKLQQEEKIQHIIDNRPEFEITKFDITEIDKIDFSDKTFHFDCIIQHTLNIRIDEMKHYEWKQIIYEMRNIGYGMVEFIDLIPLQLGSFFYDLRKDNDENGFDLKALTKPGNKCITYYGDKIRTDEIIKIRILYLKNNKPKDYPIVSGCLAFKSFDKKFWRQNFHIPSKVLEESTLITEKDYNELTTRIE